MGNSFVLFDVSIVISRGQFHCGNKGHPQNTDSPWVKSFFLWAIGLVEPQLMHLVGSYTMDMSKSNQSFHVFFTFTLSKRVLVILFPEHSINREKKTKKM